MTSVTQIDKGIASMRQQQVDRTLQRFRVHFGKRLVTRPIGIMFTSVEYVLAEGEFTAAERAWIDVFTEGYEDAVASIVAHQQAATKGRY